MEDYWNWQIVTEEKAKVLAALADLAAAEAWTFDEFARIAGRLFEAPEGMQTDTTGEVS